MFGFPWTIAELAAILRENDKRLWNHTASIIASLPIAFGGKPLDPSAVHPYERRPARRGQRITRRTIGTLIAAFVPKEGRK